MATDRRSPPSPKLSAEFRKNRIRKKFLIEQADKEQERADNAKTSKVAVRHAEKAIDLRAKAKGLRTRRRAQNGKGKRKGRKSSGGLFG